MRGTGKLAGLPELTKHMERSLLVGLIIEHTPESGEWMDAVVWWGFIRRDLDLLVEATQESYWHYGQNDGVAVTEEIRRLEGAGYLETQNAAKDAEKPVLLRRTDRAKTWLAHLSPKTRARLDFFGALDLLDKLAGL